ncbi:MAG: glycosyltransferase family 2 protein, partial [Prosthecobacter sp.]
WNQGVDACSTHWVLSLDADYVLCSGFEDELVGLKKDTTQDAFYASFRYLVFGKPLRSCLYPPRAVLFRRDRCRYVPDGHTQMLRVSGSSADLKTKIDHDDRKPLSRWFSSQDKYALLEVQKLASTTQPSLQDKVRGTMLLGPIAVFIHTLLVHRTILDGPHGWFYAFQRTLAEIMLSLRLLEKKIGKAN